MKKFISNYQLAKYLKGTVKKDEVVYNGLPDQMEKIGGIENICETEEPGWSRIQLVAFLQPNINQELKGYGWYYSVTNEEGEIEYESDKDPNYIPDPCDDYFEVSTKVLTEMLNDNFGKGKHFFEIKHPEEIVPVVKGGRWRTIGRLVAQRKRQGHFY